MAKAKKSAKKSVPHKNVLHRDVDNKFSLMLIVLSLLLFVLAAVSMSR